VLISIIIPTRNRFDYVNLLIEDILNQSVTNHEIIVVDQSDSPQKIEHCQHIISNSLGPCVSRNIGVQHAKGDVFVFLDDDGRIGKNFIEEITDPIRKKRFSAVAGAVCNRDGNYLRKDVNYLKGSNYNFIKVMTSNPDGEVSRVSISFPAGCSAISSSLFLKVGGFDETFDPTGAGEDRDMALKIFKEGFAIWYNAQAKLLHSIAPTGGTREFGSRILILDFHTYLICKKHFSHELANTLKHLILRDYRKIFFNSILKCKDIRTRYRLFIEMKNKLS
jgi:GT2 family glycosyltransferase